MTMPENRRRESGRTAQQDQPLLTTNLRSRNCATPHQAGIRAVKAVVSSECMSSEGEPKTQNLKLRTQNFFNVSSAFQ